MKGFYSIWQQQNRLSLQVSQDNKVVALATVATLPLVFIQQCAIFASFCQYFTVRVARVVHITNCDTLVVLRTSLFWGFACFLSCLSLPAFFFFGRRTHLNCCLSAKPCWSGVYQSGSAVGSSWPCRRKKSNSLFVAELKIKTENKNKSLIPNFWNMNLYVFSCVSFTNFSSLRTLKISFQSSAVSPLFATCWLKKPGLLQHVLQGE